MAESINSKNNSMCAPTLVELKDMIEPIAKKYGIKRVYLFGSRARGDNRPDSDYDFLIDVNSLEFSNRSFFGFVFDMEEILNRNVDLVAMDDIYGRFKRRVLQEKVLIYG